MQVSKIIPRIRFKLDDINETNYSDFQIYEAINQANRFFRKLCVDSAPDLIANESTGTLNSGENMLYVSDNPIKVVEARINGRKIHAAIMSQIENTNAVGTPTFYVPKYVGGNIKLFVFPIPVSEVKYSVQYINEIEEIDSNTDLSYPREIITDIEDFVVTKLLKGEAQAYDELRENVDTIINDIVPSPCVVVPYY